MSSTLNSRQDTTTVEKNTEITPNIQAAKKKRNKTGFFKKIGIGCKLAFLRLRAISDDIFVTDDTVDELFEDENEESLLERLERTHKGYSPSEERFLEEYKKHCDLEKMHEHIKSIEANHQKSSYSLEEVVRSVVSFPRSDDESDDNISFTDLDFHALREEIEAKDYFENSTNDSSKTMIDANVNIGETLWEYRKHKWLVPKKTPQEIAEHISKQSIEHIPVELYSKVYSNLVDKGKPLRQDKRINLKDLVEIINRGWIAEEKWERAAKGLA